MSALPPKADMCAATRDVRYGPIADICDKYAGQSRGLVSKTQFSNNQPGHGSQRPSMIDNAQAPVIAKRWIILLVLFLARTAMAYQFQTVGALGPILVDALLIDFVWLGTLIGLYMLPGAALAIPR